MNLCPMRRAVTSCCHVMKRAHAHTHAPKHVHLHKQTHCNLEVCARETCTRTLPRTLHPTHATTHAHVRCHTRNHAHAHTHTDTHTQTYIHTHIHTSQIVSSLTRLLSPVRCLSLVFSLALCAHKQVRARMRTHYQACTHIQIFPFTSQTDSGSTDIFELNFAFTSQLTSLSQTINITLHNSISHR